MQQQNFKDGNVFLCSITHNGLLDFRMAKLFYSLASKERAMVKVVHQTSLLAKACNFLWCSALNTREENNLKWFVMLHADVVPEEWFVDKLIAIAEQHDADLLSAVVPIKDASGLTSTAISGFDNYNRKTRLTTSQVNHPDMPETFGAREALKLMQDKFDLHLFPDDETKLLVNTGCMVARLDRPWCQHAYFTIKDRIVQGVGGRYTEEVEPEDWFFSRCVSEFGGKVMATRAVKVQHIGSISYFSNKIWGDDIDQSTLV